MTKQLSILAPAKINRFLHITGQREDGYHLLQTVFQLISLYDELQLSTREDGEIHRIDGPANVPPEHDLVVRAALLLQKTTKSQFGCEIGLKKNIPMGAGLGGGSSDAASVLWGLNELWKTSLSRQELMNLGLQLGADVPFFLLGQNAFAEGVGEILHPIDLKSETYILIYPQINIPTIEVFKSPNLTRNHPSVTISDFTESPNLNQFGSNDCEEVVIQKYQEVAEVVDWLKNWIPESNPRMSGSGSCVFTALHHDNTDELLKQLPQRWKGFIVRGLNRHPSYNLIS
jgi:4-diphosphocytidyl-2-C-methyl-D-erythritol kinase